MLSATALTLSPIDDASPPNARQIQRWFKVSLQQNAPALFEVLHPSEHTNAPRPYTISPLSELGWLRITSLDANLTTYLHHALPALTDATITFDPRGDRQHYRVEAVHLGQPRHDPFPRGPLAAEEPATWVGHTEPATLIDGVMGHADKAERRFNLHFATATTFRRRLPSGERIYEQLPIPRYIFQNLIRSWQVLTGAELVLHMQDFINDYVQLHYHNIRTQRERFAGVTSVEGFVGDVSFRIASRGSVHKEIRRDWRHYTDSVRLLAAFSFYAGVGYGTTRGLGQVLPYTFVPR